jgi:hypothetical protein
MRISPGRNELTGSVALRRANFGSTIRGMVRASDHRATIPLDEGANEVLKPMIARTPK